MKIKKLLQMIRNITPLYVRQKVGPLIAYVYYFWINNTSKNTFNPRILSIEETLDHVLKHNLSLVRFGDGEISLIDNTELLFQQRNSELAERLQEIIKTNDPSLLICVLNIWNNNVTTLANHVYWFELHHIFKHSQTWRKLLSSDKTYGDAFITRPYITLKDKDRAIHIFAKLKNLWNGKDIVLIEGEKARNGVGNDLFNNVASLKRILCPAENAYSQFTKIMEQARLSPKDSLILVSLGPTAKLIAYELHKIGYRVIDIGHIDMEYEMFLRKNDSFVEVRYKYFNEINARNPENCKDENYLKQIIATIT